MYSIQCVYLLFSEILVWKNVHGHITFFIFIVFNCTVCGAFWFLPTRLHNILIFYHSRVKPELQLKVQIPAHKSKKKSQSFWWHLIIVFSNCHSGFIFLHIIHIVQFLLIWFAFFCLHSMATFRVNYIKVSGFLTIRLQLAGNFVQKGQSQNQLTISK